MTQLSLLTDVQRAERPWKVVRRVSRQVYAELRKSGAIAKRTQQVITAMAWYRNSRQEWPTPAELARFMFERKRIPRDDSRLVAPRCTELVRGKVIALPDGSKRRVGGGVCWYLPLRRCRVSGESAHPIAIREAGSSERQVA